MRDEKGRKLPASEVVFQIVLALLMMLVIAIFVIPFLLVIGTSMVSKAEVARKGFVFFPEHVDLSAYKMMLFDNMEVWRAYGITAFVVIIGTLVCMMVTSGYAYVVSKKEIPGRNVLIGLAFVTMVFGGGLVPTYMVVKATGLIDSLWCMIIPTAMSVWNMLILRNFFATIPASLEESALLDGAQPYQVFFRIVLPLSKPVIATISLFYAVEKWNLWFDAAIWINDAKKYPLQLVLRKYVLMSSTSELSFDLATGVKPPDLAIKSAIVVISTLPMMCIYPFIQKYFVKGVMIGSVKG